MEFKEKEKASSILSYLRNGQRYVTRTIDRGFNHPDGRFAVKVISIAPVKTAGHGNDVWTKGTVQKAKPNIDPLWRLALGMKQNNPEN